MLPPSDLTWDLAEPALLALAADDLDAGLAPAPTLLAFRGDEPLAAVGLRPFAPGEVVQALVEVLALLLPLDADRIAVGLPGRTWALDDPSGGFAGDGHDVPERVVATVLTDGHRRHRARQRTVLHGYELTDHAWRWGARLDPPTAAEGEVTTALATLVDGRTSLSAGSDLELVAQLGRAALLGHEVALAPGAATELEAASRRATTA